MDAIDARTVLENAVEYFRKTPETETYGLILSQFDVVGVKDQALAVPILMSQVAHHPEWKTSKDKQAVTVLVNRLQKVIDSPEFPFRSCMSLVHKNSRLDMVFGTERAKLAREKKKDGGLTNVSLSFDGAFSTNKFPVFRPGEEANISISSSLKGWIYLYCVDAGMEISPIYPAEGMPSNIRVSQNHKFCVTDKVNEEIRQSSPYEKQRKVCFEGQNEGLERIVAVVVDAEYAPPVTLSQIRDSFPTHFLFGHFLEARSKGVGSSFITSENDFTSLSTDRIAIGSIDYIYQP